MTNRYVHILSIIGTIAVIGFHCRLPIFEAGWLAVVIFFALAGARMTSAINRDENTVAYGKRRVKRLAPEFLCVYGIALALVVLSPTDGLRLFALTGPLNMHNWSRVFFEFDNKDWLFIPLWFVGALIQLQLLAIAARQYLRRLSDIALFSGAVAIGVSTRWLTVSLAGVEHGHIPFEVADALYWTPFAHVESIVAGYIIGRGKGKAFGMWMPVAIALVAIGGGINIALHPSLSVNSLGYALGLSYNYAYLWAYPVLAIGAASLIAPDNILQGAMGRLPLPRSVDKLLEILAELTYGVYVFHGAWLVFGRSLLTNKLSMLAESQAVWVLFLIALCGSLCSAWAFRLLYQYLCDRFSRRLT
jgi:peptidoglycan/LPS O-acetylase OafA/YrhL